MTTRTVRAAEGEIRGPLAGCRDRFLIDSADWGGGFAVVEHLLAPRAIAAPMHLHTREKVFSLVLEGRVWMQFEDDEHVADVGDLVFKPRNEWHTFWNASDHPARLLEIIAPGGLEELFRLVDAAADDADLGDLIAPYSCEGDIERTLPIIERYGLTFA